MSYVEPGDKVHTWTNFLKNYALPTVHDVDVAGSLGELRVPLVSLVCLVGFLGMLGWTAARLRGKKPLRLQLVVAALFLAVGVAAYPFAQVTVNRPASMAGALNDAQAAALLNTLLKNVYRAFDFREEEDVFDKLALSVSGDLLTDIYLQNRRSMAIQQAGGAQAKIEEVVVEAAGAERMDGDGLTYSLDARWTALGSVGHWGHVHQRKNRYEAVVTVTAQDGAWKIVGLELRDERRIDRSRRMQDRSPEREQDSADMRGRW